MLLAGAGFYWFMGDEPEQASGPITAPALAESASDAVTFQIVPAESQARFIIDEVLRGEPFTVVGQTDQVAGFIAVNPANPAESTAGPIRINARTLVTDSENRNRAINRFILQTDQFEFIEFTPTELQGLPDNVTVGAPFTLQATGDLTIRDVTKPVTFEITVTPVSETRLEAVAKTAIQRGDYNLVIPDVPFVAGVDEEVQLEVEFVATSG
jgi:polyisoprenoid-binding protein YceI